MDVPSVPQRDGWVGVVVVEVEEGAGAGLATASRRSRGEFCEKAGEISKTPRAVATQMRLSILNLRLDRLSGKLTEFKRDALRFLGSMFVERSGGDMLCAHAADKAVRIVIIDGRVLGFPFSAKVG